MYDAFTLNLKTCHFILQRKLKNRPEVSLASAVFQITIIQVWLGYFDSSLHSSLILASSSDSISKLRHNKEVQIHERSVIAIKKIGENTFEYSFIFEYYI